MLWSQLEAPTEGRKGRGLDPTSPLGLGLPGAISLGLCLLGDISRGRSAGRKGSGDSRRGREEAGAERARPTPAYLCRAAPGSRTVHGCLCKYLMVVVSLILLGSFLQEKREGEKQLMYSLLVVSPRGELRPHASPSVGSLPSYTDALTSPCTL